MSIENSRILIVDDDDANILLLSKILQSKGYINISTAVKSPDAAMLFKEHAYDLVLLDINMPELNGYEVLEQLRNLDGFSGTTVIATSGDVSSKDIKKALEAGFDAYLTKPMRMNDILDAVENALQGK